MKYSILKGAFSEDGITEFLRYVNFIYFHLDLPIIGSVFSPFVLNLIVDYEWLVCRDLSYGRGTTVTVRGASLPSVNTIDEWNGKDGELPPEENIDLSDVNFDDTHTEL